MADGKNSHGTNPPHPLPHHPNPTDSRTTITLRFEAPETSPATIQIIDLQGHIPLSIHGLPPGEYLVQITATGKLLIT